MVNTQVNAHFLVVEVRKFVDNCIKTKDGIRFRKRFSDLNKMLESNELGQILRRKINENSKVDQSIISTPSSITLIPCNHNQCLLRQQSFSSSSSLSEGMNDDEKLSKKLILLEYLNRFDRPKEMNIEQFVYS